MLRVPYGIENNPTSFNNSHVNSWFVDYGNGVLGGTSDYETPIKNVKRSAVFRSSTTPANTRARATKRISTRLITKTTTTT